MSEKPQGKWAVEAYDFLRLFRRVGRSFFGVALLILGWTAYLLLLQKLISGSPHLQYLSLRWPLSSSGQVLATVPINTTTIYIAGIVVVLICWSFYSGFYQYAFALAWFITKRVIIVLLIALAVVVFIANIVLLPITWPIERLVVWRWKKQNPEKLRRIEEPLLAEAASSKKPKSEETNSSPDVKKLVVRKLEVKILEKVPVTRWVLSDNYGRLFSAAFSHIYSNGRIGFAPLNSHSYEEDVQAAKVPLQTFNWAITRVRIQLRDFEALDWIKFSFLPSQFYVSAPGRAEFVRRIFHLDILLWGSFAADEKETMWLNIHQNLTNKRAFGDDKVSQKKRDLFPLFLELDAPAVSLSQSEPFEAYAVMLLVVILVLQNRWHEREKSWFKIFDRLYYKTLDRKEILNKLASETFLSLTDRHLSPEQNGLPSTKQLLTETVGRWVGHQLTEDEPKKHIIDQLHVIGVKCTELMPTVAEHFYRLGAIECLLKNEEKSVKMFQAKEIEKSTLDIDPIQELANAQVALDDTDRSRSRAKMALARFSGHAARALNLGDDRIHKEMSKVVEELKKKTLDPDILNSTAVSVVRKMIKSK